MPCACTRAGKNDPLGRVVGGWCLLPALLVHGRESKGTVLGLEENSSKELFECCSRGRNGTH